eukprot:1161347-Pelagomonas_calceolata.AAC.3
MISALAWVPKGASRPTPKHAEPSADELEEIKEQLQRKAERGLLGDGEDGMTEEEGSSEEMEEAGEQAGSSSEEEEEGSAGAVARARAVAAAVASSSGGSSKKKGGSKAATDDIEASLRELPRKCRMRDAKMPASASVCGMLVQLITTGAPCVSIKGCKLWKLWCLFAVHSLRQRRELSTYSLCAPTQVHCPFLGLNCCALLHTLFHYEACTAHIMQVSPIRTGDTMLSCTPTLTPWVGQVVYSCVQVHINAWECYSMQFSLQELELVCSTCSTAPEGRHDFPLAHSGCR